MIMRKKSPDGLSTTDKILKYLRQNGKMSRRDIMRDLDVSEYDIDFVAEELEYIQLTTPEHGGRAPWYEAVEKISTRIK